MMKWKSPVNSREFKEEEPDDSHDVGIFTKLRDRECGEGVEDGVFLINYRDAKFIRFRTIYVGGGANWDCCDTDHHQICWAEKMEPISNKSDINSEVLCMMAWCCSSPPPVTNGKSDCGRLFPASLIFDMTTPGLESLGWCSRVARSWDMIKLNWLASNLLQVFPPVHLLHY